MKRRTLIRRVLLVPGIISWFVDGGMLRHRASRTSFAKHTPRFDSLSLNVPTLPLSLSLSFILSLSLLLLSLSHFPFTPNPRPVSPLYLRLRSERVREAPESVLFFRRYVHRHRHTRSRKYRCPP